MAGLQSIGPPLLELALDVVVLPLPSPTLQPEAPIAVSAAPVVSAAVAPSAMVTSRPSVAAPKATVVPKAPVAPGSDPFGRGRK